ncbi:hypothetical protein SAMN04487983_101087 [Streptomyces sp. yr375]|uniref:hypothetical protein n=1 Tax=Streptomyces sp. yr375 TaxID=1761906 RepID=UPI0008BBCDA3|nr:hypothetical protein [Streptomyces sp. yr375]SER00451.1 hypothetical protein SAMN04487983_101087 [Streptomyces sp. yr375]
MTAEEREQPGVESELGAAPEPWWSEIGGPVGGGLLVLAGIGLLLWAFLGRSGSDIPLIYQAAKIVAVGLVVAGTTLAARRRASAQRPGGETESAQP